MVMNDKGLARMTLARAVHAAIVIAAVCVVSVHAADPSAALEAAGWRERTTGFFSGAPERKARAEGNVLSADFTLPAGSSVSWEKKGSWDAAANPVLSLEISSNATNPSSEDYKEFGTRFPVSVTAVFGKDSQDISFKTRFKDFFRKMWHGFPPGGIRLVYAWGNRVPVGSMYRTADEETVFILAGDEEKGKAVRAKRNLKNDFMAAYGRLPKGPVTAVIVEAVRPSREEGKLSGRAAVTLPSP